MKNFRKFLKAAACATVAVACLFGCSKRRTHAEEAARAGILLVGNSADPESLDPSLATGFGESRILNALFEGLVGADTQTLEVKPAVAKSWAVSPDGLAYVFKIDENAKWSDGSAVTADDFVFAWRRALSPTIASEYAFMLAAIKNAKALASGRERDFSKLGATAADARTLVVELEKPCPYFLSLLYHSVFFPLHKKTLEKFGADKFPNAVWTKPQNIVSNGAFVLKSWEINNKVSVRRNPHYRAPELVKLNGVDFLPISNINTEDRAFRAGQLHITDSICPRRIEKIKQTAPQTFRSAKWLGVYYYLFNTRAKPLDDPRVRLALSLAIDRRAIIDNFLKANQSEAYSFVPDGCGSMKTSAKIAQARDVERAKKLLAQAGYPDGAGFPKIKITYNESVQHKPIAEAIQNMWKTALGIDAELYNLSWPAYLAARRNGDFEVARSSWIGDFAEPESFLDIFSKTSAMNHSGWANPKFDAMLAAARNAKTRAARLQLLSEAEALMMAEAPIMPIYFYSKVYQISPLVRGWNSNLLDYHDFKEVSLEDVKQ